MKDLLYGQVKVVCDKVLQAKDNVSSDQLEPLEHLMRLVQIHDAAKPPRERWPVVGILVLILLTVSILLFSRVSQTEIELDLELSGVGFVLNSQQVLTDLMELPALGVTGLDAIYLPRARGLAPQTLSDVESAIHLSPAHDGNRHGTVTLAALTMPAGTRVWAQIAESLAYYRLTLKGEKLVLRAAVNGPIRIGLANAPVEQRDFESPKPIYLHAGQNEVDLDLKPLGSSDLSFRPQLAVSGLSLFHVDEYINEEHTLVRWASSILSGTIYFSSLNDRERILRPGEMIQFRESLGEIRTLKMRNGRIALKFHGTVHGMVTGAGVAQRSLMPTYLEWLQARHGLALLWGTTLYVLGLILGVMRWWGTRL